MILGFIGTGFDVQAKVNEVDVRGSGLILLFRCHATFL
jgi:hypothetical protein